MPMHAGEDLFSSLLIVALMLAFIAALSQSYHNFAAAKNSAEDFDTALRLAERLRDKSLASGGLIELSRTEADNCIRVSELNGFSLRVEIVSLDGELLLAAGPEHSAFSDFMSPAASASLPVAAMCDNGSTKFCEIIVRIWRG